MIQHLDHLLRHLLLSNINELVDEAQVRFEPPDSDWRQYVTGLDDLALNVYLTELRQNRKLRTNQPAHGVVSGEVVNLPAPNRVEVHYLITAWSPAKASQAIEPTVDEHGLLYSAAAALTNAEPLVPSEVYRPRPLPTGFPKLIADAALPTMVMPAEGFPKYAEFWGTMGTTQPWRPAIYLTVTVPIALSRTVIGPMVTTRITEYRQVGSQESAETLVQIAGTLRDSARNPVPGAWIRIERPSGEPVRVTNADELGRYTFGRLAAGSYRLRVRAAGFRELTATTDVPSVAGYDLSLE